ncbi:TonB-dependent receptor [Simiduia curdlanivorans]|uniref:TonB-dependent receptor plug domain-containing protein n=1 Tax=Simiduia curdlanivorans TaxID=1492769 RepID=A0ABV8V349_9GAMM|nr:TonB-dependent receptor [Simiduia curdlanivorans]MDN3640964.1 TonB-dependent receptor [Simiduia curdlanivorans]
MPHARARPLRRLKNPLLALISLASSLTSAPAVLAHGDMEEVIVTSVRSHRTLDDTPLRVEILGEEELREKSNMKPGDIRMLLNESTGIQVQQSSATSLNSSIRIQGLDGRYTQMLRDGLPIYSGFSGSLSLLQITPLDLQQVEVVKGASSTLYGGGAIAGLVNLVSKTPGESPETEMMLNATSAGGQDLSAFHSREAGQHGLTLFGTYNRSDAYEPADNGLTAIPEFERVTFTPRWFYTFSDDTKLDLGVGLIDENRLGGSVNYINGNAPDEYFEENDSRRAYLRFGLSHHFDAGAEIMLKHTNSQFERSLKTSGYAFSGTQNSSFTELSLADYRVDGGWVVGLNGTTEAFDQDPAVDGFNHDYSEQTLGAFGQVTRDLSSSLVLEAGLRADAHSDYGNFILPRVSVLYLPSHDLSVRFGGGYGYKTPSLFVSDAEAVQFQDIIPIDPDQFDAETSKGLNLDINYRFDLSEAWSLTSNLLLFHTQIDKPLQLIEQNGLYNFDQQNYAINTRGAEANFIFGFGELRYFLGYTYVDAEQETASGNVELALVSQHRVNQVLVWEREDNFRIGLEAYYFSPQRRDNDTRGEGYWIFGLMTEKKLAESVTAFFNLENFTDTRQTKFENINSGNLVNPVFRDVYAPLDGFVINGGLRVSW